MLSIDWILVCAKIDFYIMFCFDDNNKNLYVPAVIEKFKKTTRHFIWEEFSTFINRAQRSI